MNRDELLMQARRLEHAGDTLKERTLAREVNQWHFDSMQRPDDPGIRRMLNCALMDLRDHLTQEPA